MITAAIKWKLTYISHEVRLISYIRLATEILWKGNLFFILVGDQWKISKFQWSWNNKSTL